MSLMDWRHAVEDRVLRGVVKITGRAQRRFIRPCLMDLQPPCREAFVDASAMLERLCPQATDEEVRALTWEHQTLAKRLRARYAERSLVFPENYAVGEGTSLVLYAWTRINGPKTIVETGVANGHSTYFLLHALAANASGALHSFDVSSRTGVLLDDEERSRWHFHLLDGSQREEQFVRTIESLAPADLFHHDSLHSYEWQTLEYETIRRTSPECLITSDDVDGSFAFVDFCERHARRAYYLVDTRKVFGVVA